LSDNKSYIVAIDIYFGGKKGFYVASPLATSIPGEEMDKIKQVLARHNFYEDSFYPLGGAYCTDDEYLNTLLK